MPLKDFIAHSSDPIYWSVIATALLKVMFKKIEKNIVQQDRDNIQKQIQELEDSSYDFISEAYKINQDQTIGVMKEKRIGGFSIIGKVLKKI